MDEFLTPERRSLTPLEAAAAEFSWVVVKYGVESQEAADLNIAYCHLDGWWQMRDVIRRLAYASPSVGRRRTAEKAVKPDLGPLMVTFWLAILTLTVALAALAVVK